MLLKASNRDYFRHLWEMLFYMIFCLSLPFIIGYISGDGITEFMIQLSIVFFIVFCVPAIVLFLRYASVNKSIEINYKNTRIEISKSGKFRAIGLSEIESVEVKLTLPIYFNGVRYFATDSFLYATVYLKSKESFTVTTLLDNELFDTKHYFSDKVDVVRKLRLICWPPNQKLKFLTN